MKVIRLVLWLLHTNCYIVFDENTKDAAVIDPAGECEKIIAETEKNSLNVKYIILTHTHIDHVMALDELKAHTGAEIIVNKNEVDMLNRADQNLADYFRKECPVSKADITVDDGDEMHLGNHILKFIHTPGHTKGCMCIFTGNMLFSGDTLFNMSVGKVDHYSRDMDEEINSIKQKLLPLPDDTVVYPGHGDKTTIGFEKNNNIFLMI